MALCPNSVTIDDFNDNIVYSGPWQAFTNQTYGFNGTRHVANTPGLSANFKFNGMSTPVSMYFLYTVAFSLHALFCQAHASL